MTPGQIHFTILYPASVSYPSLIVLRRSIFYRWALHVKKFELRRPAEVPRGLFYDVTVLLTMKALWKLHLSNKLIGARKIDVKTLICVQTIRLSQQWDFIQEDKLGQVPTQLARGCHSANMRSLYFLAFFYKNIEILEIILASTPTLQ